MENRPSILGHQAVRMIESVRNGTWLRRIRDWVRPEPKTPPAPPRIGLALGGGFARGIAHVGVLRALERNGVPVSLIAGVSAGSIVAAAYASGATVDEIELIARKMRFKDVARWTLSRFGLADSDRMVPFLKRLLKTDCFESMRVPLAVVASDLVAGKPAVFRDSGDVSTAIRASCAYPGLFLPVRDDGRYLVDGLVTMEVPAAPLREMGATHVISVSLPNPATVDPRSILCVLTRSFQIYSSRTEHEWRAPSSLVIEPPVAGIAWDAFESCDKLVEAGELAAEAAMPEIRKWMEGGRQSAPWNLDIRAAESRRLLSA
jgi:NTE family protein